MEYTEKQIEEIVKDAEKAAALKFAPLDVQKQIEAVRGLISAHNLLATSGDHLTMGQEEAVDKIEENLRDLTETLKPHLNGEKLEA